MAWAMAYGLVSMAIIQAEHFLDDLRTAQAMAASMAWTTGGSSWPGPCSGHGLGHVAHGPSNFSTTAWRARAAT